MIYDHLINDLFFSPLILVCEDFINYSLRCIHTSVFQPRSTADIFRLIRDDLHQQECTMWMQLIWINRPWSDVPLLCTKLISRSFFLTADIWTHPSKNKHRCE